MKISGFFKKHPVIFMGVYTLIYFIGFFTLERVIEPKYIISSFIDDYIPFCEYFIIPYLLWFIYVPGVLFYLVHYDRDSFWKMVIMMFIGNMVCLLIYALFPNGVPPKTPVNADNIFCHMVNILYYSDTPTNVCPSIHVLDTLSAHIALSRSTYVKNLPVVKGASFIFLVLICIATVTLKQHSIIDVFCAFLLFIPLEKLAYRQKAQNLVHSIV